MSPTTPAAVRGSPAHPTAPLGNGPRPHWPWFVSAAADLGDHPATRRYIVCSTPRCGSNLLCTQLEMTGGMGAPAEYMNPLYLRFWSERAADEGFASIAALLLRRRTSSNGVFGIKLHFSHLAGWLDQVGPESLLDDHRFIHITRRDVVAQAVSFSRAAQTRSWSATQPAQREARYDFADIDRRVQLIRGHDTAWRLFFDRAGIRPIEITYEALIEAPTTAIRAVVEPFRVDLTRDVDLGGGHVRKQDDGTNAAWKRRYLETCRERFLKQPQTLDGGLRLEPPPPLRQRLHRLKARARRILRRGATAP